MLLIKTGEKKNRHEIKIFFRKIDEIMKHAHYSLTTCDLPHSYHLEGVIVDVSGASNDQSCRHASSPDGRWQTSAAGRVINDYLCMGSHTGMNIKPSSILSYQSSKKLFSKIGGKIEDYIVPGKRTTVEDTETLHQMKKRRRKKENRRRS